MTIDPKRLLELDIPESRQTYDWRDTVLYALGIGVGAAGKTAPEMAFLRTGAPLVPPTFATVLGYQGFWVEDLPTGIDVTRVLHAEQTLNMTGELPHSGEAARKTRVSGILDKGATAGCLIFVEEEIRDCTTGRSVATLASTLFCRGDGGCGGTMEEAPPAPPPLPGRPPDLLVPLPTSPQQALIYRMSGDDNPLHYDPSTAGQAGFPQPILQGLCTYGMAGQALLMALCGGRPARFRELGARFKAPVFPGETLALQIWQDVPDAAAFRVVAKERGLVAIDHGRFKLASAGDEGNLRR